ncbi:hypothetical protein ACN28S_26765 [Cystobacter fuscus]
MNHFKTCGLAVVAMAFSACGPAPEGAKQAEGVARTESALTAPIPNTTCVVEATEPYKYDSGPYAGRSAPRRLSGTAARTTRSSTCARSSRRSR